MMHALWMRVRSTLSIAIAMGAALSLLVIVIGLLGGSPLITARHGIRYDSFTLAVNYLCSATAGGMIVGLLQPLGRWKAGAAALGILVATLFAIGLHYAERPIEPWGREQLFVATIFSLALGAPLGISYREIFGGTEQRAKRTRNETP